MKKKKDTGDGIEGNWDYHPVYPVWPSAPPPTNQKGPNMNHFKYKENIYYISVILTAIIDKKFMILRKIA